MKTFKKGFTLAETLITLSIIGIIAAITVPQLTSNFQKQRNIATASKIIYQIELGCSNIINSYNVNDGSPNVVDKLSLALGEENISNWENTLSNAIDATQNSSYSSDDYLGYNIKRYDASMGISKIAQSYDPNAVVFRIKIDSNGAGKPNQSGQDRYEFELNNSCKMNPSDDAAKKLVKDGFKAR